MSNIIEQLKTLKSHEEAGFVDHETQGRQKNVLMNAIANAQDARATFVGELGYFKWNFQRLVSRPLVVASTAFLLIAGGWMTSVNAASNSLPGDTLYSLKLVAERARLQLASSEHRAILHTEFAQRRYEEALAIEHVPNRQELFEETIDAFKIQIGLASTSLDKLREEESTETLEVAVAIDQKIHSLNAVIDTAQANTEEGEDIDTVTEVRGLTQEAGDAVLDVVVTTHEEGERITLEELDQLFNKELAELRTREAKNLARISVIEGLIEENQEVLDLAGFILTEDMGQLTYFVTNAANQDAEAMDFVAAGGYRAAFDILSAANYSLLETENKLAVIEINLIGAISTGNKMLHELSEADEEQEDGQEESF